MNENKVNYDTCGKRERDEKERNERERQSFLFPLVDPAVNSEDQKPMNSRKGAPLAFIGTI